MQKEALMGTLINTAFIGEGASKGAKKLKQEMKNPSINPHDVMLKNKPIETDIKAASIIDNLYLDKIAYTPDSESNGEDYNPKNKGNGSLVPKGVGALLAGAYIASALSHGGNFVQPLRQAKSVLTEIPHIVADKILKRNRFGKVLAKALKEARDRVYKATGVKPKGFKLDTPKTDASLLDNTVSAMFLGGGLAAGNLGVHIIGDKYFDNRVNRKSYDTTSPTFSNDKKLNYHYVMNQNQNKKASEVIDEAFEKKALYPRFANKAHFIKKVLKEDVAQNAVGSLPFFMLPAAASYMTGRDLKYDAKKIDKKGKDRITIDIPLSDFKKTAGMKPYLSVINKAKKLKDGALHQSPTWKEFFKYELPSRSVRALTWAIPATALTAITGRNIRGSLEKTDSQNKPLESGKARITIETAPHRGNEADPKYASSTIDSLYKTAIAVQVKKNETRE